MFIAETRLQISKTAIRKTRGAINLSFTGFECSNLHEVGFRFDRRNIMAGSVNKVILIGNLGRDPEVRNFPNGGKVCNLRIATSENWKDRNTGERREKTEWHSVAIFSEPLVRVAEQYLRKGSKIYIEGQLETRKWQDQSVLIVTPQRLCCVLTAQSLRC